MNLHEKKCIPCQEGTPPLGHEEILTLLKGLNPGWQAVDDHHLERVFRFRNFRKALDFVIAVGAIAEEEQHHPDISLSWGKVTLCLWTHKARGLSENDFILAAKCDTIPFPRDSP